MSDNKNWVSRGVGDQKRNFIRLILKFTFKKNKQKRIFIILLFFFRISKVIAFHDFDSKLFF